jgi:hypothetical protein
VNLAGRHRGCLVRIIHSMPTAVESDFRCQIAPERPQTLAEMSTSMPLPRIVIADDQEEILRTIAVVLGGEFDIIGTAENGKHAVHCSLMSSYRTSPCRS